MNNCIIVGVLKKGFIFDISKLAPSALAAAKLDANPSNAIPAGKIVFSDNDFKRARKQSHTVSQDKAFVK